ncbi:dTMP kinase [Peribacillus simplex]|uniref:dTMP kinase n=1 Tax=Peribacillus simplex TaxID=1478 RepID=UPI001922EBB6|nr:dTMP kinase [Peribacillus simplex]MBD8591208.1 dTMP kinase [Peribacillus simplex]
MYGKWITFEGIGGSGKSTQVQLLYDWLKVRNVPVIKTMEPGGTPFGQEIRKIVKAPRSPKLYPFTEFMLFEADRHETIKNVILPSLNEGKIVISDRGIDGTIAYQGFGRNINIELIDMMTNKATESLKPNLSILIDIDTKIAQKRIKKRTDAELDQFDLENIQFQDKVREGFIFTAKRDPERIKVIDGTLTQQEILEKIINLFEKFVL